MQFTTYAEFFSTNIACLSDRSVPLSHDILRK